MQWENDKVTKENRHATNWRSEKWHHAKWQVRKWQMMNDKVTSDAWQNASENVRDLKMSFGETLQSEGCRSDHCLFTMAFVSWGQRGQFEIMLWALGIPSAIQHWKASLLKMTWHPLFMCYTLCALQYVLALHGDMFIAGSFYLSQANYWRYWGSALGEAS